MCRNLSDAASLLCKKLLTVNNGCKFDSDQKILLLLQASNAGLGRGDLNEGLKDENFDWQWQPIAQERSSGNFHYDEEQQSPRQARLSDPALEKSSSNSYYSAGQSSVKREVKIKNKGSNQGQKINAEAENKDASQEANRPDRDLHHPYHSVHHAPVHHPEPAYGPPPPVVHHDPHHPVPSHHAPPHHHGGPPPLVAVHEKPPPECFIETPCTRSCGDGFKLLLPNPDGYGCYGASLQV